ncbi:DNA polymerase III subunit beta family protein, partial [Clavibacter michiganensis]
MAVAASRDAVPHVIPVLQLEVGAHSRDRLAAARYRVAVREIDWDGGDSTPDGTSRTALVPARTLQEIGKTFGHRGTISVALTDTAHRRLIAFSAASQTVTSLLIRGTVPPSTRIFPQTV